MTMSLRKLIETFIREDDDARKRGWSHVAFGTWEDSAGNRYRRDDSGNWKQTDSASDVGEPLAGPSTAQRGVPHPSREKQRARHGGRRPHSAGAAIAPAIHDSRQMKVLGRSALYGGNKPVVSWDDHTYDLTWESPNEDGSSSKLTISFSTDNPREYMIRARTTSGDETQFQRTIRGRGPYKSAVTAADSLGKEMDASKAASAGGGSVHDDYEKRVGELEGEGMTRSDAQGIADMEFDQKHGKGWERKGLSEVSLREMIRRMSR